MSNPMEAVINLPQNATQAPSRFDLTRIPGARQALLLVGIAVAVAIGIAIVMWSRAPNYSLLYANLDEKDAAQVVQALQSSNIDYQLGNGGTSIFVNANETSNVRLKLAAQGLPRGGTTAGDAGADSQNPFGMSELAEKARYQQMLENDLSSTISNLQSVKSARVHLALPKSSAFIRDRTQASASVMIALYPGRQLDASQVGAIVHLVAASVPELDPSRVQVIDQSGQLLTSSDPGSDTAVSDARFRLVRQIESAYAGRVEELLTPLVGAGHVRAQVFAQMDFTETEKTSENFDPQKTTLRSEQSASERRADAVASGVPGALSNQPPSAPAQPTAANPKAGPADANASTQKDNGEISQSATRNYEVDRTISHTREPVGQVNRLTVAVALDNKTSLDEKGKPVSTPFTKDELDQMTLLVRNAVGFDEKRGDNVSVVNAQFLSPPDLEPVNVPLWQQPTVREIVKQGIGALLALGLILIVLRPLFRNLVGPSRAQQLALAAAGANGLEPVADTLTLGGRISAPGTPPLGFEQKVELAKRVASQDPKQVAQVVKTWVGEDG
ncbi:MAG TPA: flagellar basal-body MS-ring/collar protein FliF [Rhodanobacteraceae bacterium]|nr:flagellar basal-body MS-ring/collar protein FliF [Rhodanobacteraceae bacterium]